MGSGPTLDVCRKKGCTHAEHAPDAEVRRCPVHGVKLWPKAKVRPIRFHDTRHSTASLLMMAAAHVVAACPRSPRPRDAPLRPRDLPSRPSPHDAS